MKGDELARLKEKIEKQKASFDQLQIDLKVAEKRLKDVAKTDDPKAAQKILKRLTEQIQEKEQEYHNLLDEIQEQLLGDD